MEKILMIGWRRDVRDPIQLFDDLAQPGSEIHIFCGMAKEDREQELEDSGMDVENLKNISIIHHVGHARRHLEKLPVDEFTACMVVADECVEQEPIDSDSQCISTLLLFRDVQMKRLGLPGEGEEDYMELSAKCPCLVEILDPRSEESISSSMALNMLAEYEKSNEMVSRVLAMVSEERSVNYILGEFLGGPGTGMELLPGSNYVKKGESLSFMQLSKRVHGFDEVVLGYQNQPMSDPENTVINPRDKDTPQTWDESSLIVIRGPPLYPDLHGGPAGSPVGALR